jgi:hypothetical protein
MLRQSELMVFFLLALGVVAFFWLAAKHGVDSRPYDGRARRWM